MTEAEIKQLFPNLDLDGFAFTSEEDWFYNCFAWAGDDNKHKWQPSTSSYYIWLTGSNVDSLENYIENYGYIGYKEITDSAELEPDFEKIAIYVGDSGQPEHAARQTNTGAWTSKLGNLEDIEHRTLECLEGKEYGKVKVILKRPRKAMKKAETSKSDTSTEFENFKNLAKNIINVPKKEVDNLKQKNKNKKKAEK